MPIPYGNKMGGKQSKVPRPPRVPDALAGDYDAVKTHNMGFHDSELTEKVHGTSASMQNRKAPNMAEAVLGQPTRVSAKDFKKRVKISSSSHGLV